MIRSDYDKRLHLYHVEFEETKQWLIFKHDEFISLLGTDLNVGFLLLQWLVGVLKQFLQISPALPVCF